MINIYIHVFVIVSLLAFLLFAIDKLFARMGVWRIPEAVLLWVAFLGGSSGALATMNLFHHKTSKRWFTLGIPLMQIGHIVLLVVMLYL